MAVVELFKSFETAGVFRDNLQNAVGFRAVKLLAGNETTDDAHHIFNVLEFFCFELTEAMLVYGNTINDILLKGFCGPDAEIGGFFGIYSVADRDNGVEVIHLHLIGFSIWTSMCIFCTYSILFKFSVFENIAQMAAYNRPVDIKKLRDLCLCSPDSFIIFVDVKNDFAF